MTKAQNLIVLWAGNPANPVQATVELFSDEFTAKAAKAAARTAFGHTNGVTATAYGVSYRMTKSGIRRIDSD